MKYIIAVKTSVEPKWGEYYIAIISHSSSNPKHKAIIKIQNNKDHNLSFYVLTYEDTNKLYSEDCLHYFELIEKLNIKVNELI